jgi:hypothetical protein
VPARKNKRGRIIEEGSYALQDNVPPYWGIQCRQNTMEVLTPKIGTGKRLTCGPSLVGEHHSTRDFPQMIR